MDFITQEYQARIAVHQIELPLGGIRREYEWQGEGNTALINLRLARDSGIINVPLKRGTQFWLGHLSLVVVGIEPYRAQMLEVALDDGRAYQLGYCRHLYYLLDNIYRRLVITAHVWGLADYSETQIPTWRDVNVLRRLAAWWHNAP